ncbi:insulin-like [Varroa jacobsoni]|uniref:Insulin-like domain-containing protein n=1 Tax=Varroa destructor TaxID=109461 RepID=A0A7M7MA72_VARDE|nr:insulin-like [Varroa destructor]XP_022647276.1 insulin-like [Varroa destructor]XP_022647277.1 insulin-like [Varroa destructor]XP_022647278.1 insulin-like [Varroa destructor]XP_022647279.1 insulin-like [Varroa destructor]XP_022686569.1 insulin-like [Varroa jacobsoni]
MYGSITVSRAILLRALIVALTLVGSQCESVAVTRWKLCGNRLSDIAIMICQNRGGIYEPRERRSGLLERAVGSYERRIRRSEDGIVEECCRKSCTYDQIIQYCARPLQNEESTKQNIGELLAISRGPGIAISANDDRRTTTRPARVSTYRRPSDEQIVFLD